MRFFKDMFGTANENQEVSKVGWRQLTDLGQLNEIVTASTENPVLIFKHSTRCAVSRMVLRQFENDFNISGKITPYFLDLLQHRDISNEIAIRFDVMHQSPQLIIIKEGKAVYNASHSDIEVVNLNAYL